MGAVKETLFVFFANVGYCVILDELPNSSVPFFPYRLSSSANRWDSAFAM